MKIRRIKRKIKRSLKKSNIKYCSLLLLLVIFKFIPVTFSSFDSLSSSYSSVGYTKTPSNNISFSDNNLSLNIDSDNISDYSTETKVVSMVEVVKTEQDLFNSTYSVYLSLNENTISDYYSYNPKVLLSVFSPEGELTEINGLNYVSATDKNGEVITGFDVTNLDDCVYLNIDYEVMASESFSEEWSFTLTYIAYEYEYLNEDFSFDADIIFFEANNYPYTTLGSEILMNEYPDATNLTEAIEYIDSKEEVNFNVVATTDEGLFVQEDVTGDSYYFRGAVDDNWVYYASYYWRIIRIDGDGNIKLIYSGSVAPTDEESVVMTGTNTQISSSSFSYYYSDLIYVGYVYDYNDINGSEYSSTAKNSVDSWVNSNISSTNKTYLADTVYCIDRSASLSFEKESWVEQLISDYSLYEDGTIYYEAYERLITNKTPSLLCEEDDQLVSSSGLISADEAVLAGAVLWIENYDYYLYTAEKYWTLTPAYFGSNKAVAFSIIDSGYLSYYSVNDYRGLRPVVSISSLTEYVSGDGSWNNPYYIG